MNQTVDPADFNVLSSCFRSIAEEMSDIMLRAAYSSIVREAKDCSTCLMDADARTVAQAEALDAMLAEKGLSIGHVIEFAVDEQALFDRVEGRAAEAGEARADDNAEVLRNRLATYREQTAPIIPYYRDKGMLERIDGMADIDGVTAQIEEILGHSGR